jgi:hypothetical protein
LCSLPRRSPIRNAQIGRFSRLRPISRSSAISGWLSAS